MRVQSQCMYATRPLKCRCNVSTLSLVSCVVRVVPVVVCRILNCNDAVH